MSILYIIPPFLSMAVSVSLALLSVIRGRLRAENILFSLLCVWSSLVPSVFFLQTFIHDPQRLLMFDRCVHTLLVYIVPLYLFFIYRMLRIDVRVVNPLLVATLLLSTAAAVATQTDYYFAGGHLRYSWGYIGRPGIAFHLFGVYFGLLLGYAIVLSILHLRAQSNRFMQRRIGYLVISFVLIGLLSFANTLAMYGYDIYPPGNFIFIPLLIMSYGVLRYHLLDIRSVIHKTVVWLTVSAVLIVPNFAIFFFLMPHLVKLDRWVLFAAIISWFALNYLYLSRVQPLVNQRFNRRHYDLMELESEFLQNIALLKDPAVLIEEFSDLLRRAFSLPSIDLFVRIGNSERYGDSRARRFQMDPDITDFLGAHGGVVDRHLAEIAPEYELIREKLLGVFESSHANYLCPIIQNSGIIAIIFIPEKDDLEPLFPYEIDLLNKIKPSFAIALDNAFLYQNIASFKENLELIVEERTRIIEQQKEELEREIKLAQKIQYALLPQRIPDIPQLTVAYRYVPMLAIGGDFIDIHYRRGFEEIGLFICDVSGHGVSAALTASMVKMSLNDWGKYVQRPGSALTEIRHSLAGKMGGNFITACFCSINFVKGKLVTANAGHPPLLIVRHDGFIQRVSPRGKLIIDFMESAYDEETVDLLPGDKIILYTDGVTELRNAEGQPIGDETFGDIIQANHSLPPALLCQKILDEVSGFMGEGRSMEDDFTVLVAEYRGPS